MHTNYTNRIYTCMNSQKHTQAYILYNFNSVTTSCVSDLLSLCLSLCVPLSVSLYVSLYVSLCLSAARWDKIYCRNRQMFINLSHDGLRGACMHSRHTRTHTHARIHNTTHTHMLQHTRAHTEIDTSRHVQLFTLRDIRHAAFKYRYMFITSQRMLICAYF